MIWSFSAHHPTYPQPLTFIKTKLVLPKCTIFSQEFLWYIIPSLILAALNIPTSFNLIIMSPWSLHWLLVNLSYGILSYNWSHCDCPFAHLSYFLEAKLFKGKNFTFISTASAFTVPVTHKYMIYWCLDVCTDVCDPLLGVFNSKFSPIILYRNEANIYWITISRHGLLMLHKSYFSVFSHDSSTFMANTWQIWSLAL